MEDKGALGKIGDVIGTVIGTIFLVLIALWGIDALLNASPSADEESLSEWELSGTEQAEYDAHYDDLNEQDYYSQQAYEDYKDDYAEWSNERGSRSSAASDPSSVDCDDFSTQNKAQTFFLENGGPTYDPYVLDEDGDGIACEWNP